MKISYSTNSYRQILIILNPDKFYRTRKFLSIKLSWTEKVH